MCRPQLNSVTSALAESIIPFVAAEPKHAKKAKKERQAKEGKKEKAGEEGEKVVAERFRTKLCRNFEEKGSCPYESRCMFAHGEGQLRTTEMNLRDGLVSEEAIRQFKKLQQRAKRAKILPAKPTEAPEYSPELTRAKSMEWWSEDDTSPVSRSDHGATTSTCSELEYAEDEAPFPYQSAVEFITPTTFRFNPYARCIASPMPTS